MSAMSREQFEAAQAFLLETQRYVDTDRESVNRRVRKFRAQTHHIRKRAHKLARRMRRLSVRIDAALATLGAPHEG